MSFLRAFSMLSPMLLRGLLSLPLMLLATGLWAAHHEHPTATDLAIQALLLLFMAALLVNVVISIVAILRERDASESADRRANPIASDWSRRALRAQRRNDTGRLRIAARPRDGQAGRV